jgi:3-carboxy-cis,cis-muconate cycloisomerase
MTVSSLTAGMFSSPAMQQIFSAENTVQRMLDFEAALSRALALAGLIPEDAVSPVLQACKASRIDLKALSLAANLLSCFRVENRGKRLAAKGLMVKIRFSLF